MARDFDLAFASVIEAQPFEEAKQALRWAESFDVRQK
jgi:hypothetical protein